MQQILYPRRASGFFGSSSEEGKRQPEIHLLFAGYKFSFKKYMCQDLYSEKILCGLTLVSDCLPQVTAK